MRDIEKGKEVETSKRRKFLRMSSVAKSGDVPVRKELGEKGGKARVAPLSPRGGRSQKEKKGHYEAMRLGLMWKEREGRFKNV